MATLSWQAGVAGVAFLIGTTSQSLVTINRSSYEAKNWQGTLFIFAVSILFCVVNVFCASGLPFVQNIVAILHVLAFVAVVVIFWVVGRVQSAQVVFTRFENHGGWSSIGLSLMIGQIAAVYTLICAFQSQILISNYDLIESFRF